MPARPKQKIADMYKGRSDGETIKLIGRSSRLSLLQIDIVKQKILAAFPGINVEVIARSSRGDALQEIPLHTVEGSDFFTQDIFDALEKGEADIAVHSLKDMSSEHFFGSNYFSIADRDDVRDIAIFNNDIIKKIEQGETIVIGTCSPRREEMAVGFLKKALPQSNAEIKIETKPIRGNVETRLRKLSGGEYDATILATAGINRLIQSKEDVQLVEELMADKKLMLLPLIECVPAPCQGAIAAEAHHTNTNAIEILKAVNDEQLFADCIAEKKEAVNYGAGCIQKFGVTTIHTKNSSYLYAAGKDAEGTTFLKWHKLPEPIVKEEVIFSSTDFMKDFFKYEWKDEKISIEQPVVFVANYKSVQHQSANNVLNGKKIYASGTRTWYELAKQGHWVEGCADALGFESFLTALQMPLLQIQQSDVCILTHAEAAERWKEKGYHAVSNYKLLAEENKSIAEKIAVADFIFWSSFSQYQFYGQFSKTTAVHACAGGETAALLKQQGIEPVIFPTIKSFEEWRRSSIRPHSVA